MQTHGVLALDLEKLLTLKIHMQSEVVRWHMTKLPAGKSSLRQWSEMTALARALSCGVHVTVGTFLPILGFSLLTCK